jgi:hypothetical protein
MSCDFPPTHLTNGFAFIEINFNICKDKKLFIFCKGNGWGVAKNDTG